ncbi:unnamed protein product [Gadus morhua 'NCC']
MTKTMVDMRCWMLSAPRCMRHNPLRAAQGETLQVLPGPCVALCVQNKRRPHGAEGESGGEATQFEQDALRIPSPPADAVRTGCTAGAAGSLHNQQPCPIISI